MGWTDLLGSLAGDYLTGGADSLSVPSDFSDSADSAYGAFDPSSMTADDFSTSFDQLPDGGMVATGAGTPSLTDWLNKNNYYDSASKLLDPSTSLGDVAGSLASEGKDNPSFLTGLAKQLGVKILDTKDPLASLGTIIGAIGMMRNSGANGANRVAAKSGVSNLINSAKGGYGGAIPVTPIAKPTYHPASDYITQAPASAGPLSLIRTGKN